MVIFALARLIRFPNLVIVALTQYLLYFFIFNANFQKFGITPRMDLFHFSLLVLVTLILTAGGYVINDVIDLEADRINKPQTQVVSRIISRRTALWIYFSLQVAGFFLAIYLSFYVHNLRLLGLYPTAAAGLYWYSSYLKRKPLFGHLLIAGYCAGVALVIWLAELPGFLSLSKLDPALANLMQQIVVTYAIFAFLTTLLRELIKVLEDETGDRQAGYCTTVVAWGQQKVKGLCILLAFSLLFLLGKTGFYFSHFFDPLKVFLLTLSLSIPLLLITLGLSLWRVKINLKQLSRLTKILMLLGVLILLSLG